jgi:hypothetical protein
MINFKKGPALSLHQVNFIGKAVDGEDIEAGHVVRLNDNNGVVEVLKGASSSSVSKDAVYGFAINNQDAGDVIESGVIGVYALDGASVIETDKLPEGSVPSDYALGAQVTTNTAGEIITLPGGFTGKVLGQVEGYRDLPKTTTIEVNGKNVKVQGLVSFLGIKLAS